MRRDGQATGAWAAGGGAMTDELSTREWVSLRSSFQAQVLWHSGTGESKELPGLWGLEAQDSGQ